MYEDFDDEDELLDVENACYYCPGVEDDETHQKLHEELAKLVENIDEAIAAATNFADKHNLHFYYNHYGSYSPDEGWEYSNC